MIRTLLYLVFCVGWSAVVSGQTSENNAMLKQALKKYPLADANQDGILTRDEARAFLKANPEIRRKERANLNSQPAERRKKQPQKSTKVGGKPFVYKRVGDQGLSLYVFRPKNQTANRQVPAMVFFFGGGWTTGSPAQFQTHCEYLAKRGMVGITVEYRVSSRFPVKIEDCIEDAKSAMRWVRENSAKLGIDPNRIGTGGGSAGGHLAACTELIDSCNAESDNRETSAKPNALVLFNPALSIAPDPRLPGSREQFDRVSKRARGDISVLSPLKFASSKQPPMLMFFGTKDRLLPSAKLYQSDSKKAGNVCEMRTYDRAGHGFFNREPYLSKTIREMDDFLVQLQWLPRMPKKATKNSK